MHMCSTCILTVALISFPYQTVIMHDPVQGKDLAHILNDLLTERALGSVTKDPERSGEATWKWDGRHVLTGADEAGGDDTHMSYGNFLRAQVRLSSSSRLDT